MTTPFIHWVPDDQTEGEAAAIYREYLKNRPDRQKMPDILKCFSLRPDFLRQVIDFSVSLHFTEGHLTRRIKEMIASHVSALNQCPY
jgi:hypothetical protein